VTTEEIYEAWKNYRNFLNLDSSTDVDVVAALLTVATVLGRIELELEGPFVGR
jgi:hypothetical protein